MSESTMHRAMAIDFATRTGYSDPQQDERQKEVEDTLRELVAYFGAPAIAVAASSLGITFTQASSNHDVLRAYSLLIIDSDRPKLTAQLVGKLAGLELSTGRRILLRDLARAEGISKQAVSKRLAQYAERLKLPRSESTEAARNSHRLMNRRNYAATRKPT